MWREAFSDGALKARDKHLMAAAVHATFRRKRAVRAHLRPAHVLGAGLADVVEAAMPLLLSHGLAAWECMVGQAARMEEFAGHEGRAATSPTSGAAVPGEPVVQAQPWADEEALRAYYRAHGGSVPDWVEALWRQSPGFLQGYTRIRALALSDGRLPRKVKELVIVACHAAHRFEKGAAIHVAGARAAGASDGEVAETLLVAVTASGIPAWLAFFPLAGAGAAQARSGGG